MGRTHLALALGGGSSGNLSASTAGSLGVLTANTETPVVTETTVRADLLETLKVLTHLLVDLVGKHVRVLAVGHVLLTVKEPSGDLELSRVLHDGDNALELIRVELSGAETSVGFEY